MHISNSTGAASTRHEETAGCHRRKSRQSFIAKREHSGTLILDWELPGGHVSQLLMEMYQIGFLHDRITPFHDSPSDFVGARMDNS